MVILKFFIMYMLYKIAKVFFNFTEISNKVKGVTRIVSDY